MLRKSAANERGELIRIPAMQTTPELEDLRRQLIDFVNQAIDKAAAKTLFVQPVLALSKLPPGKMKRATLISIIALTYEDFIKTRGQYDVRELREHCNPLLTRHFCSEDLELDSDRVPRWHGRFAYAHKQIATDNGYLHARDGIYVKSAS